MGLGIKELISGIFEPAADLIDSMHTSEEERIKAKTKMLEVQTVVFAKVLDYESRALEARENIVASEAKSDHWLAANWRPLTMLTFVALAVVDAFGVVQMQTGSPLNEEAWGLLKLGIGGYIGGRSAEKIVAAATANGVKAPEIVKKVIPS
jgi:hypothetical protein